MSASKTIDLVEPVKGPRGVISKITLRAPRYKDYMELDLPIIWVQVEQGGFTQETPSAMRAWVERLSDCDPNLMEQLGLEDTLAIRDAVTDFFQSARANRAQKLELAKTLSMPSPDSSSSTADKTFVPSKI